MNLKLNKFDSFLFLQYNYCTVKMKVVGGSNGKHEAL